MSGAGSWYGGAAGLLAESVSRVLSTILPLLGDAAESGDETMLYLACFYRETLKSLYRFFVEAVDVPEVAEEAMVSALVVEALLVPCGPAWRRLSERKRKVYLELLREALERYRRLLQGDADIRDVVDMLYKAVDVVRAAGGRWRPLTG